MHLGNICIIEDEVDIAEALTEYLENANYNVVSYLSAEDFYEESSDDFRGLYLVDWNLPGEPGINIIKRIRDKDKFSPVFMVSAFSKNEDIIRGLKAGADDYITKPFNLEELLLRVNNATSKLGHIESEINLDRIQLLPEAAAFIKDNKTVNLTVREYVIFEKLFQELNSAISREDLIKCFKNDDKMTVRNIDVHIFSLRKKVKEVELQIETVWGLGYKLL